MAKKSFATLGKVGGSGGVDIAEVYEFDPPELDYSIVETTNHNQAHRLRTWISTVGDWGELGLKMAASAATIAQLNALIGVDDTSFYLKFEFGTTDITMTFTGILTKWRPFGTAPVDGKHEGSATIKVSGDMVFGGVP